MGCREKIKDNREERRKRKEERNEVHNIRGRGSDAEEKRREGR